LSAEEELVNDRPIRRKQSWMRSQSDGFKPIKQVGVAASIGFPLLVVGALMLIMAFAAAGSWMWIASGVVLAVGIVFAASHRII
jgi:hypothetical protein